MRQLFINRGRHLDVAESTNVISLDFKKSFNSDSSDKFFSLTQKVNAKLIQHSQETSMKMMMISNTNMIYYYLSFCEHI